MYSFSHIISNQIKSRRDGKWTGLNLYSAFTDPMATKALYILPHIHLFIHRRRCQPYKAPSSSWGAAGVRWLAHGHLHTWSDGTGDILARSL